MRKVSLGKVRRRLLTIVIVCSALLLTSCLGRKSLGDGFELAFIWSGAWALIDTTKVAGNIVVDAHVSRFAYDNDFIVGLKVETDSESYNAEGAGMPGSANGFFIVPKIERVGQLGMAEREFLAACKEQDIQICNEVLADQPPPYSIQALINWLKKIFQRN